MTDQPTAPAPCAACGHQIPDPATTAGALEHETPCATCDDLAQHGTYAPCATVEHSPWADADDAELARISWSHAIRGGRRHRTDAIERARLTYDELATAAARFGIVADPHALPIVAVRPARAQLANDADPYAARRAEVIARQRETGDVWAGVVAARAGHTTHQQRYYESSDGFEEAEVFQFRRVQTPILAAGIAARGYPKPPRDPRANTYRRAPEAPSIPLDDAR